MKKSKKRLVQLFKRNRVMDIQSIQQLLGERSRRSIFRDLNKEGYLSSYTHAGKYYTLRIIPQFNTEGIWYYQDIGFSQYGNLKNIVIQLINSSEEGRTHKELKTQLSVRVHNTLLDLIHLKQIGRKLINRIYLYISKERYKANQQLKRRKEIESLAIKPTQLVSELIRIEIFAEIIRASKLQINSSELAARLIKRGVTVTVKQIEQVLEYYKVKKNQI